MEKKKLNYLIKIQQIAFILFLAFAIPFSAAFASNHSMKIEYAEFFSELENIYTFHPDLVKKTFWGLAKLKFPENTNRKLVEKEVFSCSQRLKPTSCMVDQFRSLKYERKIPNILYFTVNFSKISSENHSHGMRRIILNWQPESFSTPVTKTKKWLSEANLSAGSFYYYILPNIRKIKVNIIFPGEVSILIDKRAANSLFQNERICENRKCTNRESGVYQSIPNDNQDLLYVSYDESDYSYGETVMSHNVRLKVTKVKINNRLYNVESK